MKGKGMLKLPKYVAYCYSCEAYQFDFKRELVRAWARVHRKRCTDNVTLFSVDFIRRKL